MTPKNNQHSYEANLGEDYQRTLPSLGQAMVSVLSLFGTRRVYGVGGDFAANLINALDPAFCINPSSNEMHAGFSACAQAEIEGIGFCLTTYTVGSLPCISAAALAKTESLPVVFLSGAPGEDEVYRGAIHHTVHSNSAWQENYDAALRAFAGLGIRAERLQGARNAGQPNMAGYRFFELVAHAWQHKEPVFIEIPRDLIALKTQAVSLPSSIDQLPQLPVMLSGAELIAHTITQKLLAAKSPLVYIGEQVKLNPWLCELISNFCHRQHIPYATRWFAKGLFDEFDPLCLGTYNGAFSDINVRHYIENEVDYVVDVGSSIFFQDTNHAFNTGTHYIDQFENKTLLKATLPRERDLIVLFEELTAKDTIKHFDNNPPKPSAPVLDGKQRLDFHNLAPVLNHIQQNTANAFVYLPEIGNSYFASYGLQTRRSQLGRSWLSNPWYAAMGTCLPYARVACENILEKKSTDHPIVICGDGGFHFQLNELIHFQKQGLSLTVIYMRNNIFDLGKCGDSTMYHCSHENFDVQMLIHAYGGQTARCQTVADFISTFNQRLEKPTGLFLIEVPCIADEKFHCREIHLLNLYIKAKNGMPSAVKEWALINQTAC